MWTDGHGFRAIETYPTACRGSSDVTNLLKNCASLGHQDIDDARVCAVIAYLFATAPQKLQGPDDNTPINEDWIWFPKTGQG